MHRNGSLILLAQRAWQAVAGALTLFFVALLLSPVEQGYFYTLASLAALHLALDMGLSSVLVQFSAREFIGLSWTEKGSVEGAARHRFLTLARLSLRWYLIAAVLFLLSYPLGVLFVGGGHGELAYDWRGPWALLVVSTSANFILLPTLALSEGSGRVTEVYAVRLAQGLAGAAATWGVLLSGGGLYAVAMMPAASAVVGAVWLLLGRQHLIIQAIREKAQNFQWRTEIWPMQWRIGASWLAGYALVLMHVPLLFRTQGPVVAGQMGVTMTVANMLSLLALSWVTARIPEMAKSVAMRDWTNLDWVYRSAFLSSCATFAAGAVLFFLCRVALEWTPYGERFLPVAQTAALLVAMALYHVAGLFGAYLRAHMREPFLWPSLAAAVLTAAIAIPVASRWGSAGVVTVLVAVNAAFFVAASWLWMHLRQKWHGETS